MRSVNRVMILGTLGHNPVLKETAKGQPFCRLSLATDSWSPPDEDGKYVKKTSWHSVHAFGRQAELAHRFLQKGLKVFIEGRLETLKSEKDGKAQWNTYVTAEKLTFVDKAGSTADSDSVSSAQLQ